MFFVFLFCFYNIIPYSSDIIKKGTKSHKIYMSSETLKCNTITSNWQIHQSKQFVILQEMETKNTHLTLTVEGIIRENTVQRERPLAVHLPARGPLMWGRWQPGCRWAERWHPGTAHSAAGSPERWAQAPLEGTDPGQQTWCYRLARCVSLGDLCKQWAKDYNKWNHWWGHLFRTWLH